MRTITCQTRVLRGVVAVRGDRNALVRLGGNDRAYGKTPMFPISMRHPSPSSAAMNPPAARLTRLLEQDADAAAIRAGRSACSAGVLVRCGSAFRGSLGNGRPAGLETRSTTFGGLLPLNEFRTDKRFPATSADRWSPDWTRYAASTRGRGVA
jgi:hypothetical protein